MSFRDRQPRSPTHKVDKKEKDRAAMRPWFTPRRMTDPLSGASFNALTDGWTIGGTDGQTDERTNVDYHRSCKAPRYAAFSPSLFLSLSLSLFTLSDAREALLSGDTMWYRLAASLSRLKLLDSDQSFCSRE